MAAGLSKWRTAEDARGREARLIGPNAVLQIVPVLDRFGGAHWREGILTRAGLGALPDGKSMIPELMATRLHQQVRLDAPGMAPRLAAEAGVGTAEYILKHRIPRPAQLVLKALPRGLAARALSKAIAAHAWTFVGSGELRVVDAWTYEISGNPLIRGEVSEGCLCHWHAAVFQELYQVLVARNSSCVETCCGAQGDGVPCRFELKV